MYGHTEGKTEKGVIGHLTSCAIEQVGGKPLVSFLKDLFLLYGIFFACVYICVLHVFTVLLEASGGYWIIWILELGGLQIIESYHMDPGNRTWILWKNNQAISC